MGAAHRRGFIIHLHTSSLSQRHSLQENVCHSFIPVNMNSLGECDRMCVRDRTITELVVIKGLFNAVHKLLHHHESGLWNHINKLVRNQLTSNIDKPSCSMSIKCHWGSVSSVTCYVTSAWEGKLITEILFSLFRCFYPKKFIGSSDKEQTSGTYASRVFLGLFSDRIWLINKAENVLDYQKHVTFYTKFYINVFLGYKAMFYTSINKIP